MKIAILAAMDKEISLISSLIEGIKEYEIDGIPCHTGRINRHEVLLAKCGIGKVNAALNTLRIIRGFAPDLVINSGVAGGAGPLGIGSLLVAGEVGYHDVWCGPGTLPGAADGFPQVFLTDKEVSRIARETLGAGAAYGLIATGDRFISKAEEIREILEVFPQAQAVDMESAAICHTCHSEGVRVGIVRVISDTPGEGENISQYKDFWSKAPETTFRALRSILEAL